ncbi:MAG TPA: 16S rRNA (guanine(966)-N(2))-methyltransferase RsmD [candidate division Zixibacteria bacterium]|nr:16S rRNA (guanine(966)-N(2))-methyltransferase RsmD [candidate division Zixibacteria bacterium]
MMRVTGGQARGRRLKVPRGEAVRPTAARVKEALFNILPHDLSGLSVLELFAGTGSVAIEALSRGAERALLVDASERSAEAIRNNLRQLGLAPRARVRVAEASQALRALERAGERFDIIFLDPPYDRGLAHGTLERIGRAELLRPSGVVIAEHSVREKVEEAYGALALADRRRYGDTVLSFFRPRSRNEVTR